MGAEGGPGTPAAEHERARSGDGGVEPAGNVVRHVEPGDTAWTRKFVVELVPFDDGRLRVGVKDSSRDLPMMRPVDVDAESGRGLHVVQAPSESWGVIPHWTAEGVGDRRRSVRLAGHGGRGTALVYATGPAPWL